MYRVNIEKQTLANKNYRKIIYKSDTMEEVLMSLLPGEDIPWESHPFSQFIRIEQGHGEAQFIDPIDKKLKRKDLSDGIAITIHPHTRHYIRNKGNAPLKLYSVYAGRPHEEGNIRQSLNENSH